MRVKNRSLKRELQIQLQRCLVLLMAVLCCIEPLINAHFTNAGWEDEPGFRIRLAGQTLQPEMLLRATDGDSSLQVLQEATVYVAPSLDTDDGAFDLIGASLRSPSLAIVFYLQVWRQAIAIMQFQRQARWFCHSHAPPWLTGLGIHTTAKNTLSQPTSPPSHTCK
jgi:hypothetical protein